MIPTELIERALALTKKNKSNYQELDTDLIESEDFDHSWCNDWLNYPTIFSYPKFFAYLLSPEFIEKYASLDLENHNDSYRKWIAQKFGQTLYEYQSGNEQLLISLLQKIWQK